MSEQQPPADGAGPPLWPRRFDPQTGEPLSPGGAGPEATAPGAASTGPAPDAPVDPAVGDGERTQFLGYRPSPLPSPQQPPAQPVEEPRLHPSPWGGGAPVPQAAAWAPAPGQGVPGTDELGRTVKPDLTGTGRASAGRGMIAAMVSLVVLVMAGVGVGTFVFLKGDDGATTASGATSSALPSGSTPSQSPSQPPSESPSESTGPSGSTTPTPTPTLTAPVTPVEPSWTPPTPNEVLKTYGASIDLTEFAHDWDFRFDDVELHTTYLSAANYPSCAAVEKDNFLTSKGCKFAGEVIQRNAEDGLRLTTIVLQYGTSKQAEAAAKAIKDTNMNLRGRVITNFKDGMWQAKARKNFVSFTTATTSKAIDSRLLNRYVVYRNSDTLGAISFM